MPPAAFGIDHAGLNLFVNLLILFLIVVWLALVAWTYSDARRRVEDPVLVMAAAVASFIFPYVGAAVYTILRPPEYLEDARERKLEIRAAELRVRQLEEHSCPNCEYPLERGFLRCPNCRARVKDPCEQCGKPIDPRWSVCPYCEAPARRPVAAARRVAQGRSTRASRAPGDAAGTRKPSEAAARASARPARAAQQRAGAAQQRPARANPQRASAGPRQPGGRGGKGGGVER